jgi:hypothetical protein
VRSAPEVERQCGKLVDSRRVAARSAIRCSVLPASRPPTVLLVLALDDALAGADIGVISVTPARAHPGQLVTVVAGAYKQFPRMPLYLVTRARVRPPHPCGAGALCDTVLPRPPRRAPVSACGCARLSTASAPGAGEFPASSVGGGCVRVPDLLRPLPPRPRRHTDLQPERPRAGRALTDLQTASRVRVSRRARASARQGDHRWSALDRRVGGTSG